MVNMGNCGHSQFRKIQDWQRRILSILESLTLTLLDIWKVVISDTVNVGHAVGSLVDYQMVRVPPVHQASIKPPKSWVSIFLILSPRPSQKILLLPKVLLTSREYVGTRAESWHWRNRMTFVKMAFVSEIHSTSQRPLIYGLQPSPGIEGLSVPKWRSPVNVRFQEKFLEC